MFLFLFLVLLPSRRPFYLLVAVIFCISLIESPYLFRLLWHFDSSMKTSVIFCRGLELIWENQIRFELEENTGGVKGSWACGEGVCLN
ncbi:hypothetical protein ES332_D06G211000v1 [Gossypium tomentosum]|uniref:Uncharacterized protein n=1 Tax=Gossypium tomentosum TaxID=34277 RepID=A0A5D2KM04_GOSTO|nr:hypothetical protein ES332_D06G211000v1 [Gossypium tomentosum]